MLMEGKFGVDVETLGMLWLMRKLTVLVNLIYFWVERLRVKYSLLA